MTLVTFEHPPPPTTAFPQTLKAPGFSIGCVGSMGRGRCTCDMSADGRFVAAGAADGSVSAGT